QEGWLSYPPRPHGRAKEVRPAQGPPLVPVLEALGARERRGERKRAFGPALLLRQCGRQIGCSRTRLEEDMPSKSIDHAFAARRITGAASDPTYAGAPSFMRRRYTKNVKGADVVVWGIPFDAAVSNRPGARFGPQAIRRASAIFDNDPQYPFGIDLFEQLAVIDYGDCLLDYGHPQRAPAAIEREAARIVRTGAFLLSLGGDHSVTWPLLKVHAARHGAPLALVQFDAHQDTWPDDGRRIDHGSFVGRAVREHVIDPGLSIQIGVRTHAPQDCGIKIVY